MAKRHYTIPHFVRNIGIEMLEAYFKQANIHFPDNLKITDDDKKPNTDAIEKYINSLEALQQEIINDNFIDINDMSYEGGILSILELTDKFGIYPQKDIGDLPDYSNQALYFFLNYRDLFDQASKIDYFTNLPSRSIRYRLLKKQLGDINNDQIKDALSNELKSYFKAKEGRGEVCELDMITHKNRIFYHAHPQDFYKIIDGYDKGGKHQRLLIRPTFDVVFIYYPDEGKLELSVNGGEKRKMDLFNIFNKVVLGDIKQVEETQQAYDFNKVLSSEFGMPHKLENPLSWAYLKQIRLSHRYIKGQKVILEVEEKDATEGARSMLEMVRGLNLNTEQYNVTQITFKLKFEGAKNKGSVTARISYPDKCNLSDTPTHQRAKEYLAYWSMELNNNERID